MQYAGNNFLQSGLQGNIYNNNKSLNYATLNHAVSCANLQNIELNIYQKTIQLVQIKIKLFEECPYNTDKYWPHLNDFPQDQEINNLGSVAPGGTF